MSFSVKFVLTVLLLSTIVYAANITSSVDSASSSPYANIKSNVTTLNITIFANDTAISIGAVNVSLGSAAGNLSSVRIRNSAGTVLGINSSFNVSSSTIYVNLSNPMNISAHANDTLLIIYEISPSATLRVSMEANITSTADLSANETISGTYPVSSSLIQLQDLHANATISPRYVDTNVFNQTFLYTITPTGSDLVKNISVVIPSDFSNIALVSVKRGGTTLDSTQGDFTNSTTGGRINISLTTTTNQAIIVNFTANTSASETGNITFNSTIGGGNMSEIAADYINTGVTTRQLIRIHGVAGVKTTALPNGTDYWEFNFTINVTETTSGMIHFRTSSWNNSASQIINLTNTTVIDNNTGYYASLYLATNSTRIFNVTAYYNITRGIQLSATANNLYYVALKMIMPSTAPVSSTWWTTYSMLFRSDA